VSEDPPPEDATDEVPALPAGLPPADDELIAISGDDIHVPSDIAPIPPEVLVSEDTFETGSNRSPIVVAAGPHHESSTDGIPSPTTSERTPRRMGSGPNYSSTPMIHLNNIHKAFGERKILRGIELEIYPGETVCLIGGSGTGKSVSLKHIMRLIDPDEGRVWLDGEDITDAYGDRLQSARSKLGVNFQFGALLNWLSVFENVALPLRENTNMKEAEIERRVMQKLELLSIPHARDLFPTQISGGMVKRAGLARAVVMEESLKVILYDEPTSGLDPISTATVDDMVNEMKSRLGLTQVIVTHDMASAYRTADRIAVLYEGTVVQFGTPEEIQNSRVPYVQQFVHGLSTQEALEVGKSERLGRKEA
jgi:phospholipid/cholesterol/gamma-HCH transport system ATP-binding protein